MFLGMLINMIDNGTQYESVNRLGHSYLLWLSHPHFFTLCSWWLGQGSCDDTRLLGLTREELVLQSLEKGSQTTTGFLQPALIGGLEGGEGREGGTCS